MVDTYSDETGVLDFTRTQNGAGMSNRAAAKALIAVMQRRFQITLENIFNVDEIKQLCQVGSLIGHVNNIPTMQFFTVISRTL